jgi:hypothetical protein
MIEFHLAIIFFCDAVDDLGNDFDVVIYFYNSECFHFFHPHKIACAAFMVSPSGNRTNGPQPVLVTLKHTIIKTCARLDSVKEGSFCPS